MFVKGADNVIKERLDSKIPQPYLENADKKLTEFSIVGLRTLLIGMKIMSKDEVDRFTSQYNDLSNSPNRKEDLGKDTTEKFNSKERRKLILNLDFYYLQKNQLMKLKEDSSCLVLLQWKINCKMMYLKQSMICLEPVIDMFVYCYYDLSPPFCLNQTSKFGC